MPFASSSWHKSRPSLLILNLSFLIGGDGLIYEGRGWNVQGAHTGGFNTVGYGFCFLGDFTDHNPTQPAVAAYNRQSGDLALVQI